MGRAEKIEAIEELRQLLDGAKSIILNDFTGLNVADISELRARCRKNNVTYRVIKNTLAKRGLADLGIEELASLLEGPTAVAVSAEDEAAPAQVLKNFQDDYEHPRFKGGYVAGRLFSEAEVIRLASLPSREILLTQVVGMVQSPMRGLVSVLGASLRDLAGVLKAVAEKKGAA
jgi:large subunit ribosomal protein L10